MSGWSWVVLHTRLEGVWIFMFLSVPNKRMTHLYRKPIRKKMVKCKSVKKSHFKEKLNLYSICFWSIGSLLCYRYHHFCDFSLSLSRKLLARFLVSKFCTCCHGNQAVETLYHWENLEKKKIHVSIISIVKVYDLVCVSNIFQLTIFCLY